MAFKLMSDLITDVKVALYQNAGPSAQIYSDAIIQQMIQDAFDAIFLKRFWRIFMVRVPVTLNGTSGEPVSWPTSHIRFYEDVKDVFIPSSKRPLPILPDNFNTSGMTGTTPRFVTASNNIIDVDTGSSLIYAKIIQVYPTSSTGTLLVVGRKRPDPFETTQTVTFDATCLKHYTAFRYFADDGSNPASMGVHQGLFEARLAGLIEADQQHSVVLDNRSTGIPGDWYMDGCPC